MDLVVGIKEIFRATFVDETKITPTRKCETTLCYTCTGTQTKQIAKTFSIQQFLYVLILSS